MRIDKEKTVCVKEEKREVTLKNSELMERIADGAAERRATVRRKTECRRLNAE